MKILIVLNAPFKPNSGASGTEYLTGLHLQRLGHEVDYLWAENLSNGIRLKNGRLDQVFALPLRMRQAVRKMFDRQAYDVLHLNQPYSFLTAMTPIYRRRSVIINRSHGLEPRSSEVIWPVERCFVRWTTRFHPVWAPVRLLTNYLTRIYLRIAVKYSDGVIVSCSGDQNWLLERWHVPQEKIRIIPQAPASCFFTQPFPQFPQDNRWSTICYAGWTGITKGFHILCDALNFLSEGPLSFSFKWITDSNSHSQVLKSLNPAARRNVDLLSWMPQEELIPVLDSCGIFVLPSLQEGFGKAALEAMSRGLYVIVTDNVGMSDLITNKKDGIIIPLNNSKALVDAITEALISPELTKQIGSAARERAREFTWDRVAQETADFYQEIAQRKWDSTHHASTKENM
ncbi:MAG: glycosyltransferase family 4 protein [Aggregatilineales bacterium]